MGERVVVIRAPRLWAFVGLLAIPGCSVDRGANPHHGCEGCPAGHCYQGFCLESVGGGDEDAGTPDGGGLVATDAGAAGDAGPSPCAAEGKQDFCYEGPPGTSSKGLCRAGMHTCTGGFLGPCLGQVTPVPEACNKEDDDCNGKIDDALAPATCETGEMGACAAGSAACEDGVGVCTRVTDPATESCNGADDDCDGMTDEGMAVACYPDMLPGCTADGMGGFTCDGACAPGTRECRAGMLEPCAGHTGPVNEKCGQSTAGDDDCDGKIDEGCSCTGSETQPCSTGGSPGVGECTAGTQTCNGSTFGACMGERLPMDETCANEGHDDDCNGTDDDVPTRGDPCVDGSAKGVCRDGTLQCKSGALACDTPAPAAMEACDGLDDDCDGMTDEDFPFATDEQNCGRCGNVCSLNKTCCGGNCVDLKTSEAHCGMCGKACGSGLTCCNGSCVDTDTDENNCSTCGRQCGGLPPCCVNGDCNSVLCL